MFNFSKLLAINAFDFDIFYNIFVKYFASHGKNVIDV